MNAIYKIIGEDGKEYGPATFEQIKQWIAEGRVDSRTTIFVDGAKDWSFVGLLPEFAGCFTTSGNPPTIAPPLRETSKGGRPQKTNGYAQAGMIWNSFGDVLLLRVSFGVLGLIFSLLGLSQINANPQLQEGRGMAIAGLILSILGLLMGAGSVFANLAMNPPQVLWNVQHY